MEKGQAADRRQRGDECAEHLFDGELVPAMSGPSDIPPADRVDVGGRPLGDKGFHLVEFAAIVTKCVPALEFGQ